MAFQKNCNTLVLKRILHLSFSNSQAIKPLNLVGDFPYTWNVFKFKIDNVIKVFIISFATSMPHGKSQVTQQILGNLLRQHCTQPSVHVQKRNLFSWKVDFCNFNMKNYWINLLWAHVFPHISRSYQKKKIISPKCWKLFGRKWTNKKYSLIFPNKS